MSACAKTNSSAERLPEEKQIWSRNGLVGSAPSAWGRSRLKPRQKCCERTTIQSHFISPAAFRAGVAQFQDDDLVGHDVEFVAARRPPRHDFQAAAAQPAVGPPAQAGQPIEAGFPTPVTHYTVAPPVSANRGHITQDRRRPADLA